MARPDKTTSKVTAVALGFAAAAASTSAKHLAPVTSFIGLVLAMPASANPMLLLLHGQQLILGQSAEHPATSCKAIVTAGAARASGLYWLTTGTTPYQAYCDMTPGNAGWTLIMAAVNSNLTYNDPLWTNTTLQNQANYDTTTTRVSKYQAYVYVPFTQLRSSDTTSWSINNYTATITAQTSALSMFSNASGIDISTTFSSYWDSRTPANEQEWGCTTYIDIGINQFAYLGGANLGGGNFCDWNGGARFGQRVNANDSGTGNHRGEGWGNYSSIDSQVWTISQFLWVK